jgi:predicted RNase H-like HicB family nuclease
MFSSMHLILIDPEKCYELKNKKLTRVYRIIYLCRNVRFAAMKKYLNLIIEKFEENGEEYYLATSNEVQGLVAQGNTIEEAIGIARSLIVDLVELREQKNELKRIHLEQVPQIFNYPLILNTKKDGSLSRV